MQQESLSFLFSSSFPSHPHFPPSPNLRFPNPTLSFKPNNTSIFFPPKSPTLPTPSLETDIHSNLLYLDSLGIDFLTLTTHHPPLLSTSPSSIKSIINYMTTPPINFTIQDLRRLISMCPQLLTSPLLSHTIPIITFLLREVGVDGIFNLRKAIRRRPRLLACNVDTQLRPTFYFLQRIGILDVNKHTYLLSCSVEEKFIPRIDYFVRLGLSRRSVTVMFRRFPQLFNYSVAENYEPKLEYLVGEMGRDVREILDFPQYFSFSLVNRIKPRHEECVERGVRLPLDVMLKSNEGLFRDCLEVCCDSSPPVKSSRLIKCTNDLLEV